MRSDLIINCNYRPKINDVFHDPETNAYVCHRIKKMVGGSIWIAYCHEVEVSDLNEKQKKSWAKSVYWNDIIGVKSFIPGTNEYKMRELSSASLKGNKDGV